MRLVILIFLLVWRGKAFRLWPFGKHRDKEAQIPEFTNVSVPKLKIPDFSKMQDFKDQLNEKIEEQNHKEQQMHESQHFEQQYLHGSSLSKWTNWKDSKDSHVDVDQNELIFAQAWKAVTPNVAQVLARAFAQANSFEVAGRDSSQKSNQHRRSAQFELLIQAVKAVWYEETKKEMTACSSPEQHGECTQSTYTEAQRSEPSVMTMPAWSTLEASNVYHSYGTRAAPPIRSWKMLAQTSLNMGIPDAAVIGLCASSGIALAIFLFRRGALSAGEEPLLGEEPLRMH